MQEPTTTFSRFRDITYYTTKIGYTTIHEERKNGVRVGTTEIYDKAANVYTKMYYSDGILDKLLTFQNFTLKSFNGRPSVIWWDDEGEAYEMEYHQLHSVNDSITVKLYSRVFEDVQCMSSITYYKKHLSHRDDGPAYIEWKKDEINIEYQRNCITHREDGPAYISLNNTKGELRVVYYHYLKVINEFLIDIRNTV